MAAIKGKGTLKTKGEESPLAEAFRYAKKAKYGEVVMKQIVLRNDWKALSFDEKINYIKGAKWNHILLCDAISYPDSGTLEQAIQYHEKLQTDWCSKLDYLRALTKHNDWQETSLDVIAELVKKYECLNETPIFEAITEHKDWKAFTLEQAKAYSEKVGWCWPFMCSIIQMPECSMEYAKKLFIKSEGSFLIVERGILLRKDLSLDELFDWCGKASWYKESVEWLVEKCDDWKNISIKEKVSYYKKTNGRAWLLAAHIVNSEEWAKLSFEEMDAIVKDLNYDWPFTSMLIRSEKCSIDYAKEISGKSSFPQTCYSSDAFLARPETTLDDAVRILRSEKSKGNEPTESFVKRKDWLSLSLDDALDYTEKCGKQFGLFRSIAERADFPVVEVFEKMATKFNTGPACGCIENREDWKKLPFQKAFELVKGARFRGVMSLKKSDDYYGKVLSDLASWKGLPKEEMIQYAEQACWNEYLVKDIVTEKIAA